MNFGPNAKTLDLRRNQLTSLPENLPASLTTLDLRRNQLTSLPENLPASLTTLYLRDNPLTENWIATRLVPLLTATGKTVAQIVAMGCWDCHDWSNCPMHAVFGVSSVAQVPQPWRQDAAIFVPLFDAKLIPCPIAESVTEETAAAI